MSFIADRQTLDDLNLTGKYRSDSIFNLFNKMHTSGGGRWLEQLFHNPLTDPDAINKRIRIFQYFQHHAQEFPFNDTDLSLFENYINDRVPGNVLATAAGILKKQASASLIRDSQYAALRAGFSAAVRVLNSFEGFIKLSGTDLADHPFPGMLFAASFVKDKRLAWLKQEEPKTTSLFKLARFDHLLRHTLQHELQQLLQVIYELDVYIAIADIARKDGFCYALPKPKEDNVFKAINMRHPALKRAVGNNLGYDEGANVVFLTGANMAGKSTLMKTYGISLYLAHMGFPVAAQEMEFSVKDGIYSSINVSDNLNMGYSHFYAEVLRVKTVAREVSGGKNMVVIFDELFKGTNVKDAYDATLAVTAALSHYHNCFFMISTHIIEVGDVLQKEHSNVQFWYMPTVMEGTVPTYPYKLAQGITTDRQGMIIIENEGILDLLK